MKSIGCDIIKVERLKDFLENKKKLQRFFSESEILNIESKGKKALESLAGKFAAKEALLKALGSIVINNPKYSLKDIEVLNKEKGNAVFTLHNEIRNIVEKFNLKTYLTISHEKEYAIAFVTIG